MEFAKHTTGGFSYLTAPNIGVKHAFSTRYGEPGNGRFSEESMTTLCRALGISLDSIACLKQVHSADVRVVTPQNIDSQFSIPNSQTEADALITRADSIALMVFTADCVPILLHDPLPGVIGAVHAGWRGTAGGIAAAAVRKMVIEFGCNPANICASIGPCISKCCFETDADVADAFRLALPEHADVCIAERGSKYMIDLKKANHIMLCEAGVRNITVSGDCTVCERGASGSEYWSHRRQGKNRGSQAAVIIGNLRKP